MEKVAIVSCYFQKNYGSMLQAFATQRIVENLGYESETICIDGFAREIRNIKIQYYLSRIFDVWILKSKVGTIKKVLQIITNSDFREKNHRREQKFHEFKTKKFKLSPPYHSKQELSQACKYYKAVIVGSDQLWLPSNIAADYYTLNFVPESTNKIAYATSFGVTHLPEKQRTIAKTFLNRIQHLSVREINGQKIIFDITGRRAEIVCDPTLLLDAEEWSKIFPQEKIEKEKYIFCYFLGNNPFHRKFAKTLKRCTGYQIVSLLHLDEYIADDNQFPDKALYDVGPAEFLNLIRGAEYILTDSFHGTVFSIINGKKFFTFKRFSENSSVSTNSRIDTLMMHFQLQERLDPQYENIKKYINMPIDYQLLKEKVSEMQKSSREFLEYALRGENSDKGRRKI